MSRLNDLLRRLETVDRALGQDLKREVDALTDRRAFGLNFERHAPEAVELPGRPVRRTDKVRILAPRGSKVSIGDQRLWRVVAIAKDFAGTRTGTLELIEDETETTEALVDDLVVVAEIRDAIYPGLVSTGKVERGGDKPYHAVINAENYHALQTLLFTHRAKVDAIYIDPPYNTGAKDWKYNNDYVEGEDLYRHSKWLAFMERRLKIAKELLNPADSVLIVTIDEKEYLRLGLLLEQTFSDARIQMVSARINPSGVARGGEFRRSDEYIYTVRIGESVVEPVVLGPEWEIEQRRGANEDLAWNKLRRTGTNTARTDRPNLFYPLFIRSSDRQLVGVGEPLPLDASLETVSGPEGTTSVWPIRADGSEGNWQIGPASVRTAHQRGFVRIGNPNVRGYAVYYLKAGEQQKVNSGYFNVTGHRPDGSVMVARGEGADSGVVPTTQWVVTGHDAATHGSRMLLSMIPGRKFPFPKALYAVEDALRFFVSKKPNAVILDFFSGSGTTAHAVMRLNKQDAGRRRSISVTNNEVAADEQRRLRAAGLRPGDPEWEKWGICDYITKPRVAAAITGKTPDGDPIKGDYRFTDEFPMADGFNENVEFFTLTYQAPLRVSSNREFAQVAPLLWLRAGSEGRRIEDITAGWDVADTYGVLADLNQSGAFLEAAAGKTKFRTAFIVTDEDRLFEAVVRELPDNVEPVRLYEAYLHNFEIETRRSTL
ncbi:site-specific DNA-methyltransferase [Cryobacterium sp. M23]|uniref:site-specific DNA-methyltransferase n=1 Tax=Cryobacterium sp. M23 TaxID=2048292 RepID=UPI000CE48A75|nr:DNA methyltransferase [Cryobacterium sp. M23]